MTKLPHKVASDFEQSYIDVRSKESRVYKDAEVLLLPFLDNHHSQRKEWLLRYDTLKRFEKQLNSNKTKIKHALDIGCGNGWFTNKIAAHGYQVLGIDINQTELTQAKRIFKKPNLNFQFANVFEYQFEEKFDLITFNASIQYFEDIPKLLRRLKTLLQPHGEIHILDSPIYHSAEAAAHAKQRSVEYFKLLNSSNMSSFYFHHCLKDFKEFETLYQKKKSILNKITNRNSSPFPWLKWTSK